MKKLKVLLLLAMVSVCVNCGGCTDRKPETEQGELVMNENCQSYCSHVTIPRGVLA